MTRRVFSLWIGELGIWEQHSLRSLGRWGNSVILYSYSPIQDLPPGVTNLDAREILPESEIFRPEAHGKTFSGFSNQFRYRALNQFRGIWVDLDIIARRPFPTSEYLYGVETLGRLNGAVLSYPPQSPLGIFLQEECEKRKSADYAWGDLGPRLITEGVTKFDLWRHAEPIRAFYPVHFREVWKLFDPESRDLITQRAENSFAIHLWKNVFAGVPSEGAPLNSPPQESFLGRELSGELSQAARTNELDSTWARREWRKTLFRFGPAFVLLLGRFADLLSWGWRIHRLVSMFQTSGAKRRLTP